MLRLDRITACQRKCNVLGRFVYHLLKNWNESALVFGQGCLWICCETSACTTIPRICHYLQGFVLLLFSSFYLNVFCFGY